MRTPVRARLLPGVMMLGLALAACSPTQQQPSGGGASQPTSDLTGGTVKIGMAGYPDSLNPGNGLLSESYSLYELLFDTPIAVASSGEYVPIATPAMSTSCAYPGLTQQRFDGISRN